jgi:general stress protein 26
MAQEEATAKTPTELADRAWELADSIRTALFSTWSGARQHLTPMSPKVDAERGTIAFLVDASAEKVRHIAVHPDVVVAFVDDGGNKTVTFSGRATVSDDRARIHELWTPFAKAWWESADDPSIRLITVVPAEAELWDSPGRLVASAIMLTAAITGAQLPVGDHAKVQV